MKRADLLALALLALTAVSCTQTERSSLNQPGPGRATPTAPPPARGELTRAVLAGDRAGVQRLLDAGAAVNEDVSRDDQPMTPLLAAISRGQADIASLLVSRGAQTDLRFRNYSLEELAIKRFGERARIVSEIHARRGVGR